MPVAVDLAGTDIPGDPGWFAVAGQENLLRWATTAFIGAVTVGAGWYLSSGEGRVDDQIGPVVVAMVGLLVTVGGHASLTRRMRTRLWARREMLFGGMAATWLRSEPTQTPRAQPGARSGSVVGDGTEPSSDAVTVAAPEGRFFHRPDCPLVRNKQGVIESPSASRARAGKAPCGVCRP